MTKRLILVAAICAAVSGLSFLIVRPLTVDLPGHAVEIFKSVARITGDDGLSITYGPACPEFSPEPRQSRQLANFTGDKLEVEIPMKVTYRPKEAASVTLEAPAALIDHVKIENGTLRLDCSLSDKQFDLPALTLDVSGARIEEFSLPGLGELSLEAVDQPRLAIDMSGVGKVHGVGRTENLALSIAGAGDADLGDLIAEEADVTIAGIGHARVSAEKSGRASLAGIGKIEWAKRPTDLVSNVSGLGRAD